MPKGAVGKIRLGAMKPVQKMATGGLCKSDAAVCNKPSGDMARGTGKATKGLKG